VYPILWLQKPLKLLLFGWFPKLNSFEFSVNAALGGIL